MSRNELVPKDKIHTLFNSSLRLLPPAIMNYVSEFIPRSNIETSPSAETEEVHSHQLQGQTSIKMTTTLSQEENTITNTLQSTKPPEIKRPAASPRRKQFDQTNKRKADCSDDAATKRIKEHKYSPVLPTYEPSTSIVHVPNETLPIGGETNAPIYDNSEFATLKEENDRLKKELAAAKEFLKQMEEVNHQQHVTYQQEIERLKQNTTQIESLKQEIDHYQQALNTTQQTNVAIVQQLQSDIDKANQALLDSNKENERLKQLVVTTEEAILSFPILSTNGGEQLISKPPMTIEEKRLEYRIANFKMRKVKMPADGNCLFHSIGHHVGMSHIEVRQLIAKWLADNKNFSISNDVSFQAYESNWDNYVKEMSTLSTLGTTPCFFAAGEIFGKRIAVISGSVDGSEYTITHIPPNFKNENDILVCFADKHFDALEKDETIVVPTISEKEFMEKTWYCKSCSKENELDNITCSSCGEMTEDPTLELWNCKMCTFNNQKDNVVCDMCSNDRPTD